MRREWKDYFFRKKPCLQEARIPAHYTLILPASRAEPMNNETPLSSWKAPPAAALRGAWPCFHGYVIPMGRVRAAKLIFFFFFFFNCPSV